MACSCPCEQHKEHNHETKCASCSHDCADNCKDGSCANCDCKECK